MKALIYTGVKTLSYTDAPDPVPSSDEVVVQVEAVGVCGSDMHAWAGHDERRPAPLILGHEAAGTIITGVRSGTRVTINPLVTCGTCSACKAGRDNLCETRQIISMPPREGGFAQKVAIPERNLVDVPDSIPSTKAALAEPLACGWHGVRLAMKSLDIPIAEANCLVMGGGAIGLGAALALRAKGVARIAIAETNPIRRASLSKATDFKIFDPRLSTQLGPFDLVIDGVGFSTTRKAASNTIRPGGVIVHIGLGDADDGLNIRRMTLQEITFIGTYTYTTKDFAACAAAIFDGSLGSLDWFETRPLSQGAEVFGEIASGSVAAPKIILIP